MPTYMTLAKVGKGDSFSSFICTTSTWLRLASFDRGGERKGVGRAICATHPVGQSKN